MLIPVTDGPAVVACNTCRHSAQTRADAAGVRGGAGLVAAEDYARLLDRVAMVRGEPQSYGTQFKCVDHAWKRYSMLDPEHVEDRRRVLGMRETAAGEAAVIAAYPPCWFGK